MAYTKLDRSRELLGLAVTPMQIRNINQCFAENPDAKVLLVRGYKADITITKDTITLRFKRPTHSQNDLSL